MSPAAGGLDHLLEAWLRGDWQAVGLAGLAALLGSAWGAVRDDFLKPFKSFAEEALSNLPGQLSRVLDDVKSLLDAVVTQGETVFQEIGDAIQDILGSGEVPAQGDGGLGETHDNFTPDGEIPVTVGELPGFGGPATGMNRDDGGAGGYGGGGSAGGQGGGGGGGGTAAGGEPPTPTGEPPGGSAPTHEDLGLDPDGGAYVEHQPGEGQVVIHHPDGTTEVRPWP